MSEDSFTPGPWAIHEASRQIEIVSQADPDMMLDVVAIVNKRPDGDECDANARLIVAAPDLLEALLELHRASVAFDANVTGKDEILDAAQTKAEAAIAKATRGA